MLQAIGWKFIGVVLAVIALIVVGCSSDDTPAATPAVSSDRPTFIFFFTEG